MINPDTEGGKDCTSTDEVVAVHPVVDVTVILYVPAIKFVIFVPDPDPVAAGDTRAQFQVKGAEFPPPPVVNEILPFVEQVGCVIVGIIVIAAGCVTVYAEDKVHPPALVTVTVYVPAARLVLSFVVTALPDQI